MSSLFLGFCFLSSYCLISAAEVPDVVQLRSGRNAILPCGAPPAASITLLEWSRIDPAVDGYVFFYRNNRSFESYRHAAYRGRVELKEASALKDGDVSVVLRNATVLDSGTYECRVTTTELEGGRKKNVEQSSLVQLTVTDSGETEELRERAGDKEAGDKEAGDKEAGGEKEGDKEGGRVDVSVLVGVGVVVGLIVLCIVIVVVCKIHQRPKPEKKKEKESSVL